MLQSQCEYFKADKYQYTHFKKLCDIPDIAPPGYILRMPIYVQGERDAIIQFSVRSNPEATSKVYEFGEQTLEINSNVQLIDTN